MFYPKNVPNYERILRIFGSFAMIVFALFGGVSTILSIALVFSAVMLVGTGFIGWCPMCAMVGRKIKPPRQ